MQAQGNRTQSIDILTDGANVGYFSRILTEETLSLPTS